MNETSVPDSVDGLRARKRAATTATVERVALELALEHGYDAVTVDMICAASQVSPRTFFNYFGSKEGAVLGQAIPQASDEERTAFIASTDGDVVGALTAMLTTVLTDPDRNRRLFTARRAVISATPGLLSKQLDRVSEQESRLVELVLQRFDRQGRTVERTPDLQDEARMVVALVGMVLRFSAQHWFDDPESLDVTALLHKNLLLAQRVLGGDAPHP